MWCRVSKRHRHSRSLGNIIDRIIKWVITNETERHNEVVRKVRGTLVEDLFGKLEYRIRIVIRGPPCVYSIDDKDKYCQTGT